MRRFAKRKMSNIESATPARVNDMAGLGLPANKSSKAKSASLRFKDTFKIRIMRMYFN